MSLSNIRAAVVPSGAVHPAEVTLAYQDEGAGPAVLVLHGFTGTGQSMEQVSGPLRAQNRVIVPDLLGHGQSDAPDHVDPYRTHAVVSQLTALLDHLQVEDVAIVGYSLGGRLALSLACAIPTRIRRLALIGSTGGIEDDSLRDQRRAADEALAESLDADGIDAFVDRWEALPIFATQQALPPEVQADIRAIRLAQRTHGLANSLRGIGAGSMPHLWTKLAPVSAPAMLIAGELDERYVASGRRLAAVLADGRLRVVPGVGHAVHVEAPALCAEVIVDFLT